MEKIKPHHHYSDADHAFVHALTSFNIKIEDFQSESDLLTILISSLNAGGLRNNSFVEWTDRSEYSLLRHAARNGYLQVTDFLLTHNGDTILFNELPQSFPAQAAERTPLVTAIRHYHLDVADMLLDHFELHEVPLSPALVGVSLITLASNYSDLLDVEVSQIFDKLIENANGTINEPFRFVRDTDNFCSVLSHAASMKNMSHLVVRLMQDRRIDVTKHVDALCIAAQQGNLEIVNLIVRSSIYLQPKDFSRTLILVCATDLPDTIPTAERLINCGASLNHPDESNMTAVSIATSKCNIKLLEFLLAEGGEPMDGFEYLEDFADERFGIGFKIFNLLLRTLEVNAHSSDSHWINARRNGIPLISLLAMRCPGSFVNMVIKKGANCGLRDAGSNAESRTPLDWACRMDNVSAAQALLDAKANINAWNGNEGWTSFHTALEFGSTELITVLLSYDFNPNIQIRTDNHRGCTGLHLAVARGEPHIVELILKQPGIDVNIVRDKNCSALFDAVVAACTDFYHEQVEIVSMLLDCGADPNLLDDRKSSPLNIATEARHKDLITLLVAKNADIESKNESGDSPISIAAENLEGNLNIGIMKIILHADNNGVNTPESVNILRNKVKALLDSGNDHIVAALGLIMLESPYTRKIITHSPYLWSISHRAPHKMLGYSWIKNTSLVMNRRDAICFDTLMSEETSQEPEGAISSQFQGMTSYKDNEPVLHSENMLTWAISKNNLAMHILLESENGEEQLPREWRSDLCINPTPVGTPLRCAVDEENIEAVVSIMNVLKSAWNFQYTSKSKQRSGIHPLDNLQYHDLLLVLTAYPAVMLDFFKDAKLVPVYSWVSGINRAPIDDDNTLWISLTKERSPVNLWKNFMTNNIGTQSHNRVLHNTILSPSKNTIVAKSNFSRTSLVSDGGASVINGKHASMVNGRYASGILKDELGANKVPEGGKKMSFLTRFNFKMRRILGDQIFDSDFDVDKETGVRDMLPLVYDVANIERDVEAYVLPVKHFATYEVLYACVRACNKLENPNLFDSQVIAAVVQLHWKLYGFRIHFRNLRLYLGLLLSFFLLNFVYEDFLARGGIPMASVILLQCYKVAYSMYLIVHEFLQLQHEGSLWKYFSDPWNILDMPAYILLVTGALLQSLDATATHVDAIHSIVSLLLWCKVLYFLRPFSKYGPMVLMIYQVIGDIKIFLLILFTVMVGFGNAFYIILGSRSDGYECNSPIEFIQDICINGPGKDGPFNSLPLTLRSAFSYTLGNYDFDDLDEGLYPFLLSILWVVFMVVVTIILLNLLIAIISESYDRVSANKIPSWRLEQARIIVNIYAGFSKKEVENLTRLLAEFPWLQVLIPKTYAYMTKKEHAELDKLMSDYPWLKYFQPQN